MEALGKPDLLDWVVEKWGRPNVANIMTHLKFKPKSLTRRFFSITEPHPDAPDHVHTAHWKKQGEILTKFPKPVAGKEASLARIVELNPELAENPEYRDWYKFTRQLEGMVMGFGIHAAGMIISHFPIDEVIPCWANKKSPYITQYDMGESESLGLTIFELW